MEAYIFCNAGSIYESAASIFSKGIIVQTWTILSIRGRAVAKALQPTVCTVKPSAMLGLFMRGVYTDRNILENSYWEYRIASFNEKFCIKGINSVLPEREIREMLY